MGEYAKSYTVSEMLACFLSHEIQDGERAGVGQGLPIARAAVLLAHITHAPSLRLRMSDCFTNLLTMSEFPSFEFETDYRQTIWAEAITSSHEEGLLMTKYYKQRFYIGALQVDKFANSNILGIGDDYNHLKVRGPGVIGTPTICDNVLCFYYILSHHDKRTFVEKLDWLTTIGWGEGGQDGRKKLGLVGGGPRCCVTPLCIMDFEENTKRMRLKSVHPGVSIGQVVENTGFELVIPRNVPNTESPTEEEIKILRTRIDPQGLLRK